MANEQVHYKDLENISSKDYEILMEVALANKYPVERLIKAYGIESSYGTNPKMNTGSYQGPFQFSINTGGAFGLVDTSKKSDDRHDLKKSAQAYIRSIIEKERGMRNRISNETGNFEWIDSLDPSLRDYLLHQQGGLGVARIALAHYDGDTGERGSQWYMNKLDREGTLLANLSRSQQKEMRRLDTPRKKIEYFLEKTQKNLQGE